jgi:Amt family ammonium transporter
MQIALLQSDILRRRERGEAAQSCGKRIETGFAASHNPSPGMRRERIKRGAWDTMIRIVTMLMVALGLMLAAPMFDGAALAQDPPATATETAAPESAPAVEAAAEAAAPAEAEAAPVSPISAGDTAWIMTATALVLMMTIPGVALFYGGMVRKMNVLSTVMQSFAAACLISVVWMVIGYSLAFTDGSGFIGGLDRLMLAGMGKDAIHPLAGTIPESVFMMFQMTFAIITPALIIGAVAERIKFSSLLVFLTLWSIIVYAPIAHMVWHPTGMFFKDGVLDFAGGTVVHINAGVAGLVAALIVGKRRGYPNLPMPPHNLVLSVIGASLLWVGWFGFNAGSAVASNDRAGMAMAVTQIATAGAGLSWLLVEWLLKKKASVLGIISGAVAGLVAITPAAGFVNPQGALILGLISGVACFFTATSLKRALGYDDSLDAFGIHGIGGIIGALLVGIMADEAIGGVAGSFEQFVKQAESVVFTVVYCAVGTAVILYIVKAVMGLRPAEDVERDGLDYGLHGETVQ